MKNHESLWPWPKYIAHRGGGRLAPENTLAAMRCGAAHGFQMVEFDVKLSADGVAFLLHDDTLERTSNGSGVAGDLSWAALSQIDFGSWHGAPFAGEPAPSLYAVARYCRAQGVHCNIEIKPSTGHEAATGSAVAQAAAALWRDATQAPLLSSFSEEALYAAMQAAPQLPRALLIEGPIPPDWRARMARLGCIGLNIDTEHANESIVQEILAHGATLAVWTVNTPARAAELFSWGCHAIFTDALDSVRAT